MLMIDSHSITTQLLHLPTDSNQQQPRASHTQHTGSKGELAAEPGRLQTEEHFDKRTDWLSDLIEFKLRRKAERHELSSHIIEFEVSEEQM
jgi:hypothetical protein